jgi:hypothetical protein
MISLQKTGHLPFFIMFFMSLAIAAMGIQLASHTCTAGYFGGCTNSIWFSKNVLLKLLLVNSSKNSFFLSGIFLQLPPHKLFNLFFQSPINNPPHKSATQVNLHFVTTAGYIIVLPL